MDEAAYRPNRLKRSGRQKGGWVYLDAELLRRAGMDPAGDIEVTRYALVERRLTRLGFLRVRSRVVLNLRMVDQQEAD